MKNRIGRPRLTKNSIPARFYQYYTALLHGDINVTELARLCGISRKTAYKYIEEIEKCDKKLTKSRKK